MKGGKVGSVSIARFLESLEKGKSEGKAFFAQEPSLGCFIFCAKLGQRNSCIFSVGRAVQCWDSAAEYSATACGVPTGRCEKSSLRLKK